MTTQDKTVLHFITGLESGGGAETFLARVIPRLDEGRHVVCSMRAPGKMGEKLEEVGIEVRSLGMKNKYNPAGVLRYKKILGDIQPDVQINYLIHADIFGRISGKLFGVPKVVSFVRNKHQNWHFKLVEKLTLWLADCVLTNSQAVMDFYKKHYNLPGCTAVIPNGIPLPDPDIDTDHLYEDGVITKDDFVITSVARLHSQKNLDTLIEATALLKDEISNLNVLLVGDGEEKSNLKKLASRLRVEESVRFLGKRSDVYSILSATDVFVLPSRKEGMSNALLEAMASKLPCIVSDIPENRELITNERNGLAFPVDNEKKLSEKINLLYLNESVRDKFGEESKRVVAQKYTVDKVAKNLQNFINNRVKQ